MRPYTRANRRPYPNPKRAARQIRRAAHAEPCPVCQHPWNRHGLHGGQRVCTRGDADEPISCRDCAETAARTPAVWAFSEFARVWNTRPPRLTPLKLASPLAGAVVGGRR